MVALSESVMKNRLKRPLAEKSRWRHIRLAIKPRYLGNHALKIKSYYGTLSGNHDRSFRIPAWKIAWSAPGGEITMTSYLACNKTSLSRKPCIPDNNLLWNAIGRSWSLFQNQNQSWKIALSAPGGGLTMTSCPVGNNTSISRKPCISDIKLLWITIMKSLSPSNFYKKKQQIII